MWMATVKASPKADRLLITYSLYVTSSTYVVIFKEKFVTFSGIFTNVLCE